MIKYASLEGFVIDGPGVRKQAHRADFAYEPRPGFLYIRSRAISSRTNDNFDAFPAQEIEKGYKSFLGKPVFVNHVNEDHRRARGVIIDAALHHDVNHDGSPDTWCEVLMEVDAMRFPKLARAIILGHVDRTSMGVDVEYSICSACGNRATTPAEYCRHIPQMKGSKIIRRNASTGRPEETLIFEECFGLSFFENSLLVEDPADPTAYFLGVDDRGLRMRASASGNFDKMPQHHWDYLGDLVERVGQREKTPKVCYQMSGAIDHKLGYPQESGYYKGEGHYWNRLPDGSILDASHDQFDTDNDDPVRVFTSADPEYRHFRREAARSPQEGLQAFVAAMEGTDYEGRTGDERHITRVEHGTLPIDAVRHMPGVKGEVPGEHRNRLGPKWEDFKSDIDRNGIKDPIFITVDYGQEPKISEGNHRRDAAVELGHSHVPAEVRYFGHAERHGTVEERHRWTKQGSLFGSSNELRAAKDAWESDQSMELTDAAAGLVDASGWSSTRPHEEHTGHARTLLDHAQPVSGVLYSGHVGGPDFGQGDEFRIPLMAAAKSHTSGHDWAAQSEPYGSKPRVYEIHGAHGVPINDNETVVTGRYKVRGTHPCPGHDSTGQYTFNGQPAPHHQHVVLDYQGEVPRKTAHLARYEPEPGEPEEGRMGMGPDPSGFFPNGIALRWHQDHHALVRDALHQWKGDPGNALVHLHHEINDDPQPDSGSGKKMRAWAGALHWELHNNAKLFNRPLYRGQSVSEDRVPKVGDVIDHDVRPRGYSSNRATARRFAGRPERDWSGQGATVPVMFETAPGTHGLRVKNYLGGQGLDWSEQEHILTGQHRVTSVTPTERGLHVKTEPISSAKEAGLRAFIAGTWDAMTHTEGTHSIPIEQAKQWIDPAMKDRDKLIKFDGQGYWDNLLHSMKTEGQREPIEVKSIGRGHVVWEGNHRVHAADLLGWSHIDANFTNAQRDPFPEHRKQAAKEEPYLTLYHGTNMAAARKIAQEGFHPQNPRHTANEIEDRYGLPRDSVWNHKYNEFSRGFRGEDDPKTYFSGDRRVSEEHARIGSEVINDAMGAAWHVQHEHDAFDDEGMWNPGKADEKKRWVRSETNKHYQPAVITAHVPWSAYGPEANKRASRPFGYDEYMDLMEGGKHITTASMPGHLPKEWVHKIEPIEPHTAGLKRFVAVHSSDEVPPPMGESPIPEGHVRLFHQTGQDNAEAIRQHGISMEHARDISGPRGVWASHGTRFYSGDEGATVEFHVPYKELQETAGGQSPRRSDSQEDWEKDTHHTLIIPRTIHPHEISAIHLPWHDRYRYFKSEGMDDAVKAGEYDDLKKYPDYGNAINKIQREGALSGRMPLQHILDHVKPTDMTAYGHTWPDVFRDIEENHVDFAPKHWSKFLDHIQAHGIQTPVVVLHRSEGESSELFSGHHRVWAAHKLGLTHVPTHETDDPSEAYDLLDRQGAEEGDWHKQASLHLAVNAEDEIPSRLGTAPIPEGHVRLYHHTWSRNVPGIREHGLLAEMGQGDSGKGYGNEPSAGVWAASQHDPPAAESDRHVIEFHAHPSEIDVNGPSPGQDVHEWNKGDHNVLMRGSVKPENIIAIHAPWHTAYRQISEDKRDRETALSGGYDNLEDDPEYAHSYGRAIKKIKAEGGLRGFVSAIPPLMTREQFENHPDTMWHGTPDVDKWETGAAYGIHIGTKDAAREALHARIGKRADGKDWDGTQEWGKTLLDRDQTHSTFHPHGDRPGGTWTHERVHNEPTYPSGNASYSGGHPIPLTARPSVFPVRIAGPMTNTRQVPHEDFKANGYMRAQIGRGRARRGYFYTNVSEDEGSVSAVVPNRQHLQTYDDYVAAHQQRRTAQQQQLFDPGSGGHEHLPNPRGGHDWHHGTPHHFEHFGEEREDEDDPYGGYDFETGEKFKQPHWNTHLGQHWTSLQGVAEHFAKGQYGQVGEGKGHVITANLGIKHPKDYKLESDMDKESFEHSWDGHDPKDYHDEFCHDPAHRDDPNEEYMDDEPYHYNDQHERGDEVDRQVQARYRDRGEQGEWLSQHPDSGSLAESFKDKVKSEGHDGITYGNELEGPHGHQCAITFEDHQIHNQRRRTLAKLAADSSNEVSVAGLAVLAEDTGRVLMLQRSNGDEKDPARGTWEFPGGHLDADEAPIEGAIREWKEELGCGLPAGHVQGHWTSKKIYQGFVYVIPHEEEVDINHDHENRQVLNPDDPDGDGIEVAAWFDPKDLPDMPALRDEVASGTDWSKIKVKKQAAKQPYIGKGWWLTPEGKKIGVYDHYETTPGMARSMIRPHMAESGQVRVRSFNNQLNIQTSRPFTDKQRQSLLLDSDKHSRVFVDVLHPDTEESIHSESGGPEDADRMLSRAHRAAIPHTAKRKIRNTEKSQKCEWCQQPATKSLLWAEGMAYIPTCDDHEAKTRSHITDHENDEVVATHTIKQAAGLKEFVALYDEEGKGHNEGPSPYEADERDEEGFNPDGKCPYCGADKNHDWNTEHNDGHEMPYAKSNTLWRGFHIPTNSHPDLSSGDPEKMAKAVMSRTNVGVHWSRDFHRARDTFALPPKGHVGVLMGVRDWKCKDRAPVDPGYSYENEVRFKEGTSMKLDRLDLYPDRDQISHTDRERNWRKWQDLERHVKGRKLTATYHETGQWSDPPSTLPNGDRVSGYGDAVPGGYNESLRAFHPETGEETGRLDVNTARHDPSHLVAWMHTPEEHRGRGTMVHLLEHYRQHLMEPGHHLDFGMTTPEGQAWIDKHQPKTSGLDAFVAEDEDWRGLHQPSMGPPIHNLLEPDESGGSVAPNDIYTHMHYYTDGEDKWDSESHAAIQQARGDRPLHQRPASEPKYFSERAGGGEMSPAREAETDEAFAARKQRRANGEHHVTIYRAAPKGLKSIGPGDWVTPSASYARDHARHATDPKKDWPVYKARVPAKHVRWAGDSLNEFGYNGPEVKPIYHTRGGSQAERLALFVEALGHGDLIGRGLLLPLDDENGHHDLANKIWDHHPDAARHLLDAVHGQDKHAGEWWGRLNPKHDEFHTEDIKDFATGGEGSEELMDKWHPHAHGNDEDGIEGGHGSVEVALIAHNRTGWDPNDNPPNALMGTSYIPEGSPHGKDMPIHSIHVNDGRGWRRLPNTKGLTVNAHLALADVLVDHVLDHPRGGLGAFVAELDPSEVTETSPEEFHRRFSETMAGSPFEHHVTNHTPEEIRSEGMKPLSIHGGTGGVLIHDHKDGRIEATGLYNHPEKGVRGAGVDLLKHAVKHHGVNYVECYGPNLPGMYEKAGFHTTEKYKFDRSQAHPDWDYETHGTPDYHIMRTNDPNQKTSLLDPDTEIDWDNPEQVRALKAEMTAKLDAEGGEDWANMTPAQKEMAWKAAWFLAGMGPEHPEV